MSKPRNWLRRRTPALISGSILVALLIVTVVNLTWTDSLAEARSAAARGDLQTALRASLDTLERRPWSPEANLLIARSLSRLDFADAAEPYYQRFRSRLSLDDLHVRAYGFVRTNQRLRAIQAYHEILDRDPSDTLALRRLAGVQMTQSNNSEVLKLANRLIAIPEGAVQGYTLRGLIQHNQENLEDSVEAFDKVIELDPELKLMPLPLGIFWGHYIQDLIDLGRTKQVSRLLEPLLEKTPEPPLMNALARAYYLEGNETRAEHWFQAALDLDPTDIGSRVFLGKIFMRHDHNTEALAMLEEAVRLSPRNYDALYSLSTLYRNLERTEDLNRLKPRLDAIRNASRAASTNAADSPARAPQNAKAPIPRNAL